MSTRRFKQVSNETLNDVLVVRHQDVSVVCIHDNPLDPYLLKVPNETLSNIVVVCLQYILELRYRNVLLVGLY